MANKVFDYEGGISIKKKSFKYDILLSGTCIRCRSGQHLVTDLIFYGIHVN